MKKLNLIIASLAVMTMSCSDETFLVAPQGQGRTITLDASIVSNV